jgi:pantoate--beta-alanine ligase
MGALHPGHLSLVEAARLQNQVIVASIFVNPAQFNDPADFEKYPVTIEKDIEMLAHAGCDLLFLPTVAEIYPGGWKNDQHYDLGFLETVFEGPFRPGHFQGVCQVMERLLRMVTPDHLYMGQKDYQQCMVVARLLEGMHSACVLHTCPTLREKDGLAMSSRNIRLNPADRKSATAIFEALHFIKANLVQGDLAPLLVNAKDILIRHGFRIDYLDIADARSLAPVERWNGEQSLVALAAAFMHDVRLIDNMLITPAPEPNAANAVI